MKIFNKNVKRYVSCFLVVNLLFQVCSPTAALALTGGPSQPEMESFEPVSTNQMVQPFSGDFVYNIPLLTVPGPNGGYPVNIAYHAGIGMEQEASWVGLGWNINPGVINRQMRGIPDDFNGSESILKTTSHKPNWTATLGLSMSSQTYKEVFGLDMNLMPTQVGGTVNSSAKKDFQLYFNNYKGVGFSFGSSVGIFSKNFESIKGKWNLSMPLSYSFDSQDGIGFQTSLSFDNKVSKNKHVYEFGLNASFNSRQGLTGLGFTSNMTRSGKKNKYNYSFGGVSFSSASFMPPLTTSMGGITGKLHFEYKTITNSTDYLQTWFMPGSSPFSISLGQTFSTFKAKDYMLSFSEQFIKPEERDINYPAYGYLHLGKGKIDNRDKTMFDYNRERDVPLSKDIPALPMPVNTYDVFSVNGQGTGGVFRAFREEMGIFSEPNITNDFQNVELGMELGLDATGSNHYGGDFNGSYSESYSGAWKNLQDDLNNFDFDLETSQKNRESVYFKMAGELTANADDDGDLNRFNGELAFKPKIEMKPNDGSFKAKVYDTGLDNVQLNRSSRETRSTSIEYKTRDQIHLNSKYTNRGKHLWNGTDYEAYDYTNYGGRLDHHIAQVSVLNPDGNRYTYGIPAYNTLHREFYFSCVNSSDPSFVSQYAEKKTTGYDATDVSVSNGDGYDKYYSRTQIPAYAHSYLLTEITSPDYVDLKRDGLTDDDFGYYVKFNYYEAETFKWRAPYKDAALHKNGLPDKYDDKASFSYGEKEQWYVHSIETKTHIAIFELEDREDGYEVASESNSAKASSFYASANTQKRLKTIKLYSKNNSTPIKTVTFEYDYSLCEGVYSNKNASGSNTGKLTLKKIKFSYLNNTKGELSPYVFDYHEGVSDENPDYELSQMDRWGNYKPDELTTGSGANDENPYVDQNPSNRANVDKYAAAWSLKEITLPSGSHITVDYEADDYAYVQDQLATQMFKIVGTGKISGSYDTDGSCSINKDYKRILFELENGNTNIANYLTGIEDVYFKAYVDLKGMPDYSARAKDYISGYAETTGSGTVTVGGTTYGFVDFKEVKAGKLLGFDVNPIRKAGWEYLQNDKPNYIQTSISNNGWSLGWSMVNNVMSIITNSVTRLAGFYKHAHTMGWAKEMITNDSYYPSYIRLVSPDRCKVGGGHRVKKLTISDSWSDITSATEGSFDYGQEFSYKLTDGSSAGVAEYEPMVGGEENPLKLPSEQYSENKFILANKSLYLQKPYGESYYPAANVGYSRVTVKSLTRSGLPGGATANKTRSGYSVQEFYTAKDFPVIVEQTAVTHKKYSPKIIVPFVGSLNIDNRGLSQGYAIMLNDMHGKQKSTSTYGAYSNPDLPTSSPTSKVSYTYNTIHPYSTNNRNILSPFVKVLDSDANERLAALGQTYDFFAELNEHSSFSFTGGAGLNLEYQTPAAFAPSLWFNLNYLEAVTRMAVTNKVIYRTGILTKVETRKDGGTSVAENLLYDAKTGAALLTSVNNNFDKPVYTYNFASHWDYNGMGDAAARYGLTAPTSTVTPTGGVVSIPSGSYSGTDFQVGDMVEVVNTSGTLIQDFWVDVVSSSSVKLIDEFGDDISFAPKSIKIIQPIQRNLLAVNSGSIVSLNNPTTSRSNIVINAFNNQLSNSNFIDGTITFDKSVSNCELSGEIKVRCSLVVVSGVPIINIEKIPLPGTEVVCAGLTITLSKTTIADFEDIEYVNNVSAIVKKGNTVYFNNSSGVTQFTGQWSDPNNCFPDCMDGVLHASSSTYSNDWEYNYADIGNPVTTVSTGTATLNQTIAVDNPYRYGTKGIWRTKYGFGYQVDRKQSAPTDISKDGTYKNFTLFNWQATDPLANDKWTFTNEITRYSPYGFELENQDALKIYKSALYGYGNALVTGIAENASYHETAFEGFEDHSTSYSGGHGHLNLSSSASSVTLSSSHSHSGNKSVVLATGETVKHTASVFLDNSGTVSDNMRSTSIQNFTVINLNSDRKYVVSAWFKKTTGTGTPTIDVKINGTSLSSSNYEIRLSPVIDGWQKVDYTFTLGTLPSTSLEVVFGIGGAAGYVDDIRIQPFKSAMVTYVYDPQTLWLLAELDNRNFATFYNYDEEGTLVQVKKETEKGVSTIKTSRSNISR